MGGDKLIFELGGRRFGLDTGRVASIAESEKLTFIPGQSSFVIGVISLRGEPVAVVDAERVFTSGGAAPYDTPRRLKRDSQEKIVVAGDGSRSLGFYIGASKPYFLWGEELMDFPEKEASEPFITSIIESGDSPISIIDWTALFDEATRILATE